MTKPVDAGSDTVVDADPADVNASACPPEALRSETMPPEPDGERVIVSSSIGDGVEVAPAVAPLVARREDLLVAVGDTGTAANLSRRAEINPTAATASGGTGGAPSDSDEDSDAIALATGGEVMTDADARLDSPACVVDWITDVAGARPLVAAAFLWDDAPALDAVDACEAAACADPDDEELEPPVSA